MTVPKLRFKEFINDWKITSLGSEIGISSASRVLKEQWRASGVPFFRTSDVISIFKSEENQKVFISYDLFETLSNKSGRIKKGDLLITGGGSIGIPYLKKDNSPLYFKDADLLWLKSSEKINGEFLYNFFQSQSFKVYLKSISHTGTISHFTIEQAKTTPINLPSKEEQTKIANFLTTVDKKISQLNEQHQLMIQYKKGMMQKIFSQEIRFKDDNGEEFGEWEERTLGDVSTVFSGGTPSSTKIEYYEGVIPFIKSGEISSEFTAQFINDEALQNSSAKLVSKGDLLYALYGATSGQVAISKLNGAINQAVLCIRSQLNTYFLYSYLLYSKEKIISTYLQGGQGNLSAQIIKEIDIPIPTLEEQIKIANLFTVLDQKIGILDKQIEYAKTWKKGLLQQMFV